MDYTCSYGMKLDNLLKNHPSSLSTIKGCYSTPRYQQPTLSSLMKQKPFTARKVLNLHRKKELNIQKTFSALEQKISATHLPITSESEKTTDVDGEDDTTFPHLDKMIDMNEMISNGMKNSEIIPRVYPPSIRVSKGDEKKFFISKKKKQPLKKKLIAMESHMAGVDKSLYYYDRLLERSSDQKNNDLVTYEQVPRHEKFGNLSQKCLRRLSQIGIVAAEPPKVVKRFG
ncbi:hypothetical protein SNEBB_008238 [Seison nebaliae]|nr:hypothetical protein SNEBB_008238 [Seison nebaliae]